VQQLFVREGVAIVCLALLARREQPLARVVRRLDHIPPATAARHVTAVGALQEAAQTEEAEKNAFEVLMLIPRWGLPKIAASGALARPSDDLTSTLGGIIDQSKEGYLSSCPLIGPNRFKLAGDRSERSRAMAMPMPMPMRRVADQVDE
jgi:hypothetical protein